MAQLTRGRTKRKHLDSPSAEDPHCKAARQVQGSEEVVEHDAAQLVKSLGRLNLPGEIRNRIYHFAVENKGEIITLKRRGVLPSAVAASQPQRLFLGLTQCSQLIRQEFLPLYAKNTEIWIDFEDLGAYVGTFFPSKDPAAMAMYVARIALRAESLRTEVNNGIDLLPFIKLLARAPGIHCRLAYQQLNILGPLGTVNNEQLTKCLFVNHNPMWLEQIEGEIEKIEYHGFPPLSRMLQLCPQCGQRHHLARPAPYLNIVFKTAHRKAWMDDGSMSYDSRNPLKTKFLEDMGLEELTFVAIKVVATIRRSGRIGRG